MLSFIGEIEKINTYNKTETDSSVENKLEVTGWEGEKSGER